MTELPEEEQEFIVSRRVEGWEPSLIGYSLRQKQGSPIRDETVREFLEKEETQQRIEKEKQLIEKKAEVSREDLIRELNEQITILRERSQALRESENDEIGNDTTKNLLNAVRDLADMIDVLESKDGGGANVVNVNKLEQNFDITNSVEYLPAEDKKGVVEQLKDDPAVDDFLIKRRDEVEEVVEK